MIAGMISLVMILDDNQLNVNSIWEIEMETTTFGQFYKFARNNGYLVALYWLKDNQYHLLTYDATPDRVDDDMIINTRPMLGNYTDYKEATFEDKMTILHNTYNLPETIPA